MKRFYFVLLMLLSTACEYDYNSNMEVAIPKVVVNSYINPDSVIVVDLFWSGNVSNRGSGIEYDHVEQFDAKIYENGNVIFDATNLDSTIVTNLYPKEGASYRLEVQVPNYGEVSAETSIPRAPAVNVEMTESRGEGFAYDHFRVNTIELPDSIRAIYVKSSVHYDHDYEKDFAPKNNDYYYATNAYCDQTNTFIDNYDTGITGSSIYFDYYIRVPYIHLSAALPLSYSVMQKGDYFEEVYSGVVDEWGNEDYEVLWFSPTHYMVNVIAASSEYDKYVKSSYQQNNYNAMSPEIFVIHFPINSNIKNGLGVFAGYSATTVKIEI